MISTIGLWEHNNRRFISMRDIIINNLKGRGSILIIFPKEFLTVWLWDIAIARLIECVCDTPSKYRFWTLACWQISTVKYNVYETLKLFFTLDAFHNPIVKDIFYFSNAYIYLWESQCEVKTHPKKREAYKVSMDTKLLKSTQREESSWLQSMAFTIKC